MSAFSYVAGRARRAASISWRDDGGYTITELAIAATVMLIVASGVMALMLVSIRQNDNQSDRVVALDEARNALFRMTSEVRSAAALDSVNPQVLDVLVHFPEDTANPYHWIRYKCIGNDQGASSSLGGTCSRQDKDLHAGNDCDGFGAGDGCVLILRNVVKYGEQNFAEPCDNYDAGSNEEKNFCVRDNRTVELSLFIEVPGAENPIELRGGATVRNCMQQPETAVPCVTTTPSS